MITNEKSERFNTVIKANDLINKSRFSLSLQQQKIILYIISKINPFDNDFKLYDFSIREFCDICGIEKDGGNIYNLIKEQIKSIADKSVWIRLENGKETLLRWIEKPYIDEKSGIIQIKIDNDMKPFLLHLNQNYTQYELIYTLHFKSKYTIRLYEFIKSVHYNKKEKYEIEVDVEELKQRVDGIVYNEFKTFHNRVLKKSVDEINKYSDCNITYELIKKNRKVIKIKFYINSHNLTERIKIWGNIEKEMYGDEITIFQDMKKVIENE